MSGKSLLQKEINIPPKYLIAVLILMPLVYLYLIGILDWTSLPRNLSSYRAEKGEGERIYIQPFGKMKKETLNYAKTFLEEDSKRPVTILPALEIPKEAFGRPKQIDAGYMHKLYTTKESLPDDCFRIVTLTMQDMYVDDLNFVLGLAIGPKDSIISLHRLRPERDIEVYIDDPQGKQLELYQTRIRKILRHEIGHTLGLLHCIRRKCVMRFANSVAEQDSDIEYFCPFCTKLMYL